ncbi:hypothetical protein COCC4DRAFT_75017 [Bipolaris maydis ATCC 48331]|uniref:C2H2-type domain-containing protein n=2 Tax=Cochliobolus heterostrophus TaxID=5016 RepID=M2V3K4_COCH5|nr:uncharacterized protein COCC4DRAFT_75017 [Bipolaris maydis ATCC 48331]EMD94608.1 hypothetical protein COCHEDRAFT_1167611 [Bipolaris maydis C5]KAJ5029045.1 hypothetical protein J3E73DRAFT_28550 [Bipolaris maydis]ENI01679.1 hypothetical protein COCC4DRAFT_75017 [Bipolaris maydis ATCC 48331]KAJ5062229.1 hypothetical protein J3E74DRAFT_268561 [Bipolaris maydis]KAJ6192440.1 hypothetical protein J3E72DRAFT_252988 [Bipolaris maydis]
MASSDAHSQRSSEETQNLYNVIDSATPERVRALLKHLSTTSPANFAYIQGELMLRPGALKRARSEEQDKEDDDTESDYSDEQTDAPVRRPRFDICEQCGEEYDVLHNEKKSCQWHEGELEVDYEGDFWADHDERCHGTIDTQDMREVYPEGFIWSCCDELGTEPGCKETRHRPNRAKRVKK